MNTSIVLIGPISVGKTTIAEQLAQKLLLPYISMDLLRYDYYLEIGYDEALAQQKRDEGGWWERYRYWKQFEAHAVTRILADHPVGVIDFGAGHSVYEDEQLFQRVAATLAPYPYIFLLVPSADVAESVQILAGRDEAGQQLANVNEHFLRHHSNYDLAKFIIYTKGKSPDEICDELLAILQAK